MRIRLHRWEGDELGWNAWSFDHLGFATWAATRSEVLDRAPQKLEEYCQWLAHHRGMAPGGDASSRNSIGVVDRIEVVEEIAGNEVAFEEDLLPASDDEISRCSELLGYLRRDLLNTVEPLPAEVMDWDPPYRHFASYVWWRTIRQILKHIALTEVGYYLPSIGWRGHLDLKALQAMDWQEQLRQSREEAQRFLEELRTSSDRIGLRNEGETWTVRKVLRRLVWHERLHLKSIRRIVADYERRR